MLKVIQNNDKTQCCGCRACEQVCAQRAIMMRQDEEGFIYPLLNESLCINCGLCEKVCPIANAGLVLNGESKVYAAQNLDKKVLKKSSSGGIFSVIARKVLQEGGVVYGATFDSEMILSHRRISSTEELPALRGSKYLQSDTKGTFTQAKQDLKQGKYVYYTGTPCQIAGLKLFLRKEYDKLITSDFVCHGTPSQKIFSVVVSQIEKEKKGKITAYSFRDKTTNGWSCSSSSSVERNGKNKYLPYDLNMKAYFNAFLNGHLFQHVCYNCSFARQQRVGDISLADYWGIEKIHPEFPNISEGVSLILINTEKGLRFWQNCVNDIVQIESDIKSAQATNGNLQQASIYSPERELAYSLAFEDYGQFKSKYSSQETITKRLKFYTKYLLKNRLLHIYNLIKR